MTFQAVVGHRRIVGFLSRAVFRVSLPPSLIFAGPQGVGKHTTALAVAQAVNCDGRTAGSGAVVTDACGACAACRRIARGVHTDVQMLGPDDAGSIKIEPIREAIERTAYRPFEGRRRVLIIDDADALVEQAQHALLKTLEEPPGSSSFMLVTSRPDALLPTIRSRCPVLRFGALSADDVAGELTRAHGKDPDEARALAAVANGSLGAAQAARTAALVAARADAVDLLHESAPGGDPRRRLGRTVRLGKSAASPALEREYLRVRLTALRSLVRDLQILVTRADDRWLANADVTPRLRSIAGAFDGPRLVRAFSAVGVALAALDRNASHKIVADWLVFQI